MAARKRIAVLGSASFLGSRTLRRLAERHPRDTVVSIDIAAPPPTLENVRHRHVDLTRPASDQELLDVLRDEGVGTLLHFAFFTNPRRDSAYAHELESIGSLSVFAAAAAAGVGHVVMRSFTAVYGARGQNPNFLTEDRPLAPNPRFRWARDKHEAEQHAASFAKRFPDMRVTVLRMAPLLGPGVHTFYTSIFDKRVVPMVMGYDPLLQLLHPEDAVDAIDCALEAKPDGAVNVVPRGTIPLVTALLLSEKVPVPVPHPVAYVGADALWSAGIASAPGGFVDFARFLFVADGAKAEEVMKFKARYTSREALEAYLGYRHPTRIAPLREVKA
jgi:UDP-glucose 4-epimerase